MFKNRGLSMGLAAIGVTLLASAASAAIVTSYPGTECVREVSLGLPGIVYQNSRVTNLNANAIFVACPAIQQGGVVLAARVSGRDLTTTGAVSCHLEAMDPFDGTGSFGATVSTGVASMGNYTLKLPPPATFFSSGSKVVHCTLPAADGPDVGSAIGSYAITET